MGFIVNSAIPPVRNTSATLISTNDIFEKGRAIFETDTNRGKVGDGVTAYVDLTYPEWTYEEVTAAGTDTYTATFSKDILLVYFNMMRLRVKFTNANTGASTLNINGLGAIAIRKNVSAALALGDILAGGIYHLHYDGTNFQLEAPSNSSGAGTVTSVSVVTNQGVSGSVANPTTTPAITLTLGALTGVTSFNGLVITANTGVITTGTWNATVIGAIYGGTGQTTVTTGDLLYGSAANTWSKLADVAIGSYLRSGGVGVVPLWSTLKLPNTATTGRLVYTTGADTYGDSSTALFDGTTLILGATTVVASETWSFQRSQNAATFLRVYNATSGTAARAGFILTNAGSLNLAAYAISALYTTSGIFVANTAVIQSSVTDGFNIGTNVSAQFSFWTNNLERARFLSTGEFILGATAVVASEFISIQKSQNASTFLRIKNATSGTAALTGYAATNSGNFNVAIYMVSAGYTTSGIFVADAGVLQSSSTIGLNVGTTVSSPVSFWTNDTKKVEISSVGNMSLGGVAVRATTVGTNTHQIFDGTAPVGTLANGVSLFSENGILKTADAAGVVAFILASSAVTTEAVTSDTTLTIKHNGTTYKILAKA